MVEVTFNLHTDGVVDHFCLGLHLPITVTLTRSQGFIRGGEVRSIDVQKLHRFFPVFLFLLPPESLINRIGNFFPEGRVSLAGFLIISNVVIYLEPPHFLLTIYLVPHRDHSGYFLFVRDDESFPNWGWEIHEALLAWLSWTRIYFTDDLGSRQ